MRTVRKTTMAVKEFFAHHVNSRVLLPQVIFSIVRKPMLSASEQNHNFEPSLVSADGHQRGGISRSSPVPMDRSEMVSGQLGRFNGYCGLDGSLDFSGR